MRQSITLTALVATTVASAQSLGGSLGGISSNCQQAALTLLGSEFAQCSDLSGLLGVATASGSIVEPINSWLGGLCTQGNCSDSAIANATSVIDGGCSSDLSDGNVIIETIRSAVSNFNADKQAICLESTANNTYCLTSLLESVSSASGQSLDISSLATLNISALTSIPASTICTECNSGLLYKFQQAGSLNQSEITQAQQYCGNQQFGTSLPQGVAVAGSSNSSTGGNSTGNGSSGSSTGGTNGASSIKGLSVGIVGIVAGTFALLA
ncbi:hypothetical protein JCM5353_001540 [Sporobolomyces roseus]